MKLLLYELYNLTYYQFYKMLKKKVVRSTDYKVSLIFQTEVLNYAKSFQFKSHLHVAAFLCFKLMAIFVFFLFREKLVDKHLFDALEGFVIIWELFYMFNRKSVKFYFLCF